MSTDKATSDVSKDISAIFKSPKKLKQEIRVLSAFHNPPVSVKMVMDAVCVLLDIVPSWKASRKLLGDCSTLTQKLMTYDKDNVDPIAIAKIRKDFLTDPIFDLDHVRKAAWAAGTLCEWVMAIEAYDRMEKGSGGTVELSK